MPFFSLLHLPLSVTPLFSFSPKPSTLNFPEIPLLKLTHTSQRGHKSINAHNPSLEFANIYYSKSRNYNVQIVVDENDSEEALLRKFQREVRKAGILQECRRRMFFENKRDKKKRKARELAKKNRFRRYQPNDKWKKEEERWEVPKETEEEDNWELPEGGIPY